jgi:hypothetical protein
MKNMIPCCPLCKEKITSDVGERHCKLCAMPLDDEQKEFCSRKCRKQYKDFREQD